MVDIFCFSNTICVGKRCFSFMDEIKSRAWFFQLISLKCRL